MLASYHDKHIDKLTIIIYDNNSGLGWVHSDSSLDCCELQSGSEVLIWFHNDIISNSHNHLLSRHAGVEGQGPVECRKVVRT